MVNITEAYRLHAAKQPDKPALIIEDTEISWREWHERVCRTANFLDAQQADRKVLAFLVPNGLPFLQLFAGAAMAGWTAVPFDEKWTDREIAERLQVAKPGLFVSNRGTQALSVKKCLEQISHMPAERPVADLCGNLPFYMGFTSGTSGKPKAFIRSHESWVESFVVSAGDFHVTAKDDVLIPGALVHSHFLFGALSSLHLGGTVRLLEKFSAPSAARWIDSGRISTVYAVPTMIEALAEREALGHKLKVISSGAKWLDESKARMEKAELQRYELYGASELSFVTVMTEKDEAAKPGSVGRACQGVEIEIRDSHGGQQASGEIGKIFVRSLMLFDGYLLESGELVHISDERGFITVDDMGYMDTDGYVYIVGREKNMILYGGLNIYPEEIERVLADHPGIEEVAVVGLSDAHWGEIAVAVIKGSAARLDLQRACRKELASFKIPRRWIYVQDMPHTTSGKIARAQLKAMVESGELN